MDSTLQGAFIGAAATICASIIGYRALRKPEQGQTVITVLPDRLAVFKEARKLVESAQCTVVDTTWGSSEENFLPAEKVALNEYLSAKDIAVKNPKLDYREIFTEVPDDEHRTKRIEAEQKRQSPLDRYSARLLTGIAPSFPMIDFLIVDGEKMVLSCLSKDGARADHHHLYVESVELSLFLTRYFQICWDKGSPLRPRG
jgi:hypothetical protein